MKTKPNLADWAEAIMFGIAHRGECKETTDWLEAELNDIANKYYLMGFEDGDKNGWWKEQDE